MNADWNIDIKNASKNDVVNVTDFLSGYTTPCFEALTEGYYVSTVGLNEATVRKYIQEQEKYDIAMDKLSVKEYEDPFKR